MGFVTGTVGVTITDGGLLVCLSNCYFRSCNVGSSMTYRKHYCYLPFVGALVIVTQGIVLCDIFCNRYESAAVPRCLLMLQALVTVYTDQLPFLCHSYKISVFCIRYHQVTVST